MSDDKFSPIDEQIRMRRQRVNLDVDALVQKDNTVYRITHILDFETLVARDVDSGRNEVLKLDQVKPLSANTNKTSDNQVDIAEIADDDWKIANSRYAAIEPLLKNESIGRSEVNKRSQEVGVSTATLYRWLVRYRSLGVLSSLIPMDRGWRKGHTRLDAKTEALIDEVIQSFYLTVQRSTQQKTVLEVLRLCQQRGIPAPSPSAIRARIDKVSERNQLRGRGFREKARNKFLPSAGQFPDAEYPLAVIQIDHTPADIILVDDIHRKPIGRPWITLAMDIYSRMITGYYLSFDPPSETSVAMCVAHSILPKEDWLTLHKVDSAWPVWGFPRTIHVDNGADFRSNNFRQSCLMHGIHLSFRPVKQPEYGGHIERVLGTFLREIHNLPGTTFSSISDRKDYDSEKHAVMTKSEFETWLVKTICKVYHPRKHTKIGMSPNRKWEIGIFGNADTQGIGMPSRPVDRLSIMLDFLPAYHRTVQTFGVTIENITYYADTLRSWINATDPETGKKKRLVFRRDPRDISFVWFFDPELRQYFKAPVANLAWPAMSVWEYRQAKEKLKREGHNASSDALILMAITELRNDIDESKEKTKKARRQAQRRREHEKNITPAAPIPAATLIENDRLPADSSALFDDEVEPFGDIR